MSTASLEEMFLWPSNRL